MPDPAALSDDEKKDIVSRICARIAGAHGPPEKVSSACRAEGISWSTLWDWKADRLEFAAMYTRARQASADPVADEILEIADGTDSVGLLADRTAEFEASLMANAEQRRQFLAGFRSARVQRDALRIKAREFIASKRLPLVYGDKLDLTTNGETIRPAVALLPPLDPMPVPPSDPRAVTFTEVRRIEIGAGVGGALAAAGLRAVLQRMKAGTLADVATIGPSPTLEGAE